MIEWNWARPRKSDVEDEQIPAPSAITIQVLSCDYEILSKIDISIVEVLCSFRQSVDLMAILNAFRSELHVVRDFGIGIVIGAIRHK